MTAAAATSAAAAAATAVFLIQAAAGAGRQTYILPDRLTRNGLGRLRTYREKTMESKE